MRSVDNCIGLFKFKTLIYRALYICFLSVLAQLRTVEYNSSHKKISTLVYLERRRKDRPDRIIDILGDYGYETIY